MSEKPVVFAFSELDTLEELAREAAAERAEGWTTGPAIARLQDAAHPRQILTLQETGSERENPCCYSLHEFEQVCPRTGSTFRPDTVR